MIDYEGLNKHRLETKNEILKMINENDRVAVVRPTGYGKSHLITELCNELPGKKLILEPGKEVINYMEKFGIETIDTDYDTYYSLLKPEMVELIIKFEQYDYIFLDEMHRALAEKWGNKLFNIFKALNMLNNKVKILGFSATPIRGDNKNVVEEVFHGIQIEPYYLADAILDNFLPMPNYHCGIYEIENEDKNKMVLKDEQLAKQILEYDIDASLSKMFKENLDFNKEHKIICFVDRVNSIKSAYDNIIKWFGININVFEVNHKQSKNKTQSIINEFISTKGINVLFCVNILNEGVHLPGVDCVIFLRKTKSNVIYNQQLGRVINTEIKEPIIFDLVNNADNPEWGYITMFEEKAEKQNKKVTDLETKNKDKLKITLEQVDLIEKLKNINNNKRTLTKEDEEFIINNKDKYSIAEFCKILNYSRNIIKYTYIKYNISDYKREMKLSNEDKEFIINNKDKYTISEFAKMFSCNNRVISNVYKKYNINDYKRSQKLLLTKENEEFIINNKDKYTIGKFSKMFNCSRSVIENVYKKYNINDYKKCDQRKLSSEDEEFIINNKDEYSITEFSKMLNYSVNTINSVYKRHNINNYKKGNQRKISDKDKEFIINNKDKYTISEFAKMFNCKGDTISRIYKIHNINDYKKGDRRKISNKDEEFIINNKDKYTKTEFAKMLNSNFNIIDGVYKRNNINDYKKGGRRKILDKDEEFIINNKDKYTITEFSKMFNYSNTVIVNIYKRNNINNYKGEKKNKNKIIINIE